MEKSKHPYIDLCCAASPEFAKVIEDFRAPIRELDITSRGVVIMALFELLREEAARTVEEKKRLEALVNEASENFLKEVNEFMKSLGLDEESKN